MIFCNNESLTKSLKQRLSNVFHMKDLGPAKQCLGIRIEKTVDGISLDQESYIESMQKRFNMTGCKSVAVPMNSSEKWTKDMCPVSEEEISRRLDL